MKNSRGIIVRIIAILLCALMVLGVCSVLLGAFAVSAGDSPATGSSNLPVWFIVAAVIAVIAIVVCLVATKRDKNGKE